MKAKAKKLILANALSTAVQAALFGLLTLAGVELTLAVGISKGASWGLFGLQLLLGK
jgi:hypothetical protein